ncbi:MAG: YdbL family protein [Rickettsiales bacterium]|nr:YdbL family protein [Rickettsiales bacterium]
MQKMKFTLIAFVTLFLATSAFALDLNAAKQQGLVGEQPNGYIGAVVGSTNVSTLVNSINLQRKQAYLSISRANQQPLKVVETLAAQKLYGKLASGQYYRAPNGSWKRK